MVQKQEQNIFIGKNPRPENVEYIALEGYVRNVRPFKIFENEDGKIYHTMCIMADQKKRRRKIYRRKGLHEDFKTTAVFAGAGREVGAVRILFFQYFPSGKG